MAKRLPTILVVEDDPDTRRFMETWLEFEGYRVRVASNGREALEMIAREKPCVMVVDLMMPVMDGAEFRRRLQGMPEMNRIPFVLVSGTRDAPRIAQDLGISDVLPKPCDAEHLLRIVAAHCQRSLSRSGRTASDLESCEASFEEERRCAT